MVKTIPVSSRATVLTIGHSTRPIDEFVALLNAHGVKSVIDVRTIPRSRHNPQFNADALRAALAEADIAYTQMPKLGGLRHPKKESFNTGWHNDGFRGFADYMQTDEFASALDALIRDAEHKRTAILCAEAVPWRCHRSLIADALTVRGIPVAHILSDNLPQPHHLTSFAKVDGHRIIYPPPPEAQHKLL